jgi:predicted dehydrogenase
MIDARNDAKRFVAVGFQWCFSDSILRLKKDILSGRFGAPTGGRTLTLWPRAESYYQRNDWAGKRRDSAGRWILDSPANNAMAHHIHNLLFLLGPTLDRSAEPALLRAFLGRANEIETFDTVAAGIRTASGAELLFLASHAIDVSEAVDPRFRLDFEEGSVEFTGGMAPIRGRLPGGEIVEYPSPDATSQVAKLWFCSRAVREKSAIPCGLETARPHTTFVEALERSAPAPFAFPREVLRETDTAADRFRWVEGLAAAFRQSYATGEWPEPPGGHP